MKSKHLLFGFVLIAVGAIGLFATSASAISFKIENGLTDVGVTPLADAQSASEYYNYTPATILRTSRLRHGGKHGLHLAL